MSYMNWITTNIQLPEDLYMDLKMKAAKQRKSVAAVIREKLTEGHPIANPNAKELLDRMHSLAEKVSKENKGINMTQGLINMRYEE